MIDANVPHRVLKAGNFSYIVAVGDSEVVCRSRKKVKNNGEILAGDMVYLEQVGEEAVIKGVVPRKNFLIRPAIANIDQVVMMISPLPAPDFMLIDKVILNCHAKHIDCILCVNKTDIKDLTGEVVRQYAGEVGDIVTVNVKNQQINAIIPLLKDKITCLAGQSAAGKSSLINLITGKKQCEVGQLSEKIQRGKNTTTAVSLVPVGENSYVADTPGFSLLDVFDIDADDLDLYYNVYVDLSDKCRYRRCKHIAEPGCEVKRRVDAGLLSKERYERYKQITSELQSKNKYKGGLL